MISKLILGTVQMGFDYGINNNKGKISDMESYDILREAYKSGIDYLDTAESYGNAHEIIGKFHRLYSGVSFRVITKLPDDTDSDQLEGKIDTYKESLSIEKPEAVMFHSFSSYHENPILISKLAEIKNEGKIRYLGVSVYKNEEIEILMDDAHVDIIQLPFNLFDNENLRGDILKKAKECGKIIHTRSAFLQGLFFKDPTENHPVVGSLEKELSRIKKLSKQYETPITAMALQYCLQQSYIDKVIIGVDSLQQLKANIEACESTVPASLFNEINDIRIDNIDLINPSLWKQKHS